MVQLRERGLGSLDNVEQCLDEGRSDMLGLRAGHRVCPVVDVNGCRAAVANLHIHRDALFTT